MLGVPWLHSSKTTYQLAVLWLYSNLHPKHRLRHPNVLGLRRGQSQDHWNSSKFTPWPLRHGAAEQCCFKCSRVPVPSKKCISTSWRMGWQSNGRCGDLIFANAGDAIMVVVNLDFQRGFETKKESSTWCVLLHPGAHIVPTLKLILLSYPSQNARSKSLPLHCGVYPPGGIPRSCLIYLWFHWNRKQKTSGHQNINRKLRKTSSIFTISFK